MPVQDRHDFGSINEENSRLAEGLKTCRAVIRNYRSLLTVDIDGEATTRQAGPRERNDPAASEGI